MLVRNKKGITLATAVILILFASAVALSTAVFIGQRFSQQSTEGIFTKVIYLAQAGLNYAIYQYRNSATLFSGTVNLDANNYAVVSTTGGGGSGQAALLQINATGSYLGNANKNVLGITLNNTSLTSSITLAQVILYFGSGTTRFDQLRINAVNVYSTDTNIATTPVTMNMTDVVIPANTTRTVNYVRWKNALAGTPLYMGFIMGDGTTTTMCQIYPAPTAICQSTGVLTIKSMGRTTGSNIYRTVQGTYNTSTGKVTSCSETNATVP